MVPLITKFIKRTLISNLRHVVIDHWLALIQFAVFLPKNELNATYTSPVAFSRSIGIILPSNHEENLIEIPKALGEPNQKLV